jgi:hypothetical protein
MQKAIQLFHVRSRTPRLSTQIKNPAALGSDHTELEIHVYDAQPECFADPHPGSVQEQQQATERRRRHDARRTSLTFGHGFYQPASFGLREDIGNEVLRCTGERSVGRETFLPDADCPVFKKDLQCPTLLIPGARPYTRAVKELCDADRSDVAEFCILTKKRTCRRGHRSAIPSLGTFHRSSA